MTRFLALLLLLLPGLSQARLPRVDHTFSAPGVPLVDGTNTFRAVAVDALGRLATNTSQVYLPRRTNTYQHDANGNLTSDGKRRLDYDAEDQLIRVVVTNATLN